MLKKIILISLLSFLMIDLVFTQEARIDIEHIGYGETAREAYFSIHNVGKIPITDVTIYVDGTESQKIIGKSSPGRGFETVLYLEPGEHMIEVRTPEGAYDSLNISISPVEERFRITTTTQEEAKPVFEENKIWVAIGLLMIIIVVVWLLMRKPKLVGE